MFIEIDDDQNDFIKKNHSMSSKPRPEQDHNEGNFSIGKIDK